MARTRGSARGSRGDVDAWRARQAAASAECAAEDAEILARLEAGGYTAGGGAGGGGMAGDAEDAAAMDLSQFEGDGFETAAAPFAASVAAARLTVLEAARRVDAAPGDPDTNRWVWRAKLLAGETAMEVGASMLEAAGTSATRRGSPLERIYRDARCGSLQPATSDVCADWLGAAALGLDPEPGKW